MQAGGRSDHPTSRPTSKDVAQAAGVSQSTVSLVLGGKWSGRVSPATARAVRDAAGRLGYRPNTAARNLRLGTTRTVLLVVPTIAQFFGEVYVGAAQVAGRHGFSVVVYPPDDAPDAAPDGPFAVLPEAVDGIIASSMAIDMALDTMGGTAGTPLVMLDSDPAGPAPTVDFAVGEGMRAVAAHLAALGHHRVGHVASRVDQWTFRTRAAALDAALPDASVTRARGALTVPSAKDAAGLLLDAPDRPTALVCDDDVMAAGAYKAARARGLDVPGDVSITGFDDVGLATALEPELTTVRLPARELGAHGMEALLELLHGGAPAPRSLPVELIVRRSTAPPPVRR